MVNQGLKGAEARCVGADQGPVRPGEERQAVCPGSRSDSLNVQVSGPEKHDCFSSARDFGVQASRTHEIVNSEPGGPGKHLSHLHSFIHTVVATRSRKRTHSADSEDGAVQFISPAGPRQSLLLAKDPDQFL